MEGKKPTNKKKKKTNRVIKITNAQLTTVSVPTLLATVNMILGEEELTLCASPFPHRKTE